MSNSQHGKALFLGSLDGSAEPQALERVSFARGEGAVQFDEGWLQRLIMKQPGILGVGEIEPAFAGMVPVCTELPMRAGFADNLFITPDGGIAVVECKLWRNPEARRAVVAQIVDYASELAGWTYVQLEEAVQKRLKQTQSLANFVGVEDEVVFHDQVTRTLQKGRFLLLIVGDGIREGLESIASYLERHAGLHFSLALLELAVLRLPKEGGYVVQPRLLARTRTIERVVFQMGGIAAPPSDTKQPVPQRGTTLTEESFLEELDRAVPGMKAMFTGFLEELHAVHVAPSLSLKTLTLRWKAEDDTNWNLGTFLQSGEVWLDYHAMQAKNASWLEASKAYLGRLAALAPGSSVQPTKSGAAWNLAGRDGRTLRLSQFARETWGPNGWVDAIRQFQRDVSVLAE